MIPFLPGVILIFLTTVVSPLGAEEPKMKCSAKAFATLLAPTPSPPGDQPADFGNLRQRMIALVEAVEASKRTNCQAMDEAGEAGKRPPNVHRTFGSKARSREPRPIRPGSVGASGLK